MSNDEWVSGDFRVVQAARRWRETAVPKRITHGTMVFLTCVLLAASLVSGCVTGSRGSEAAGEQGTVSGDVAAGGAGGPTEPKPESRGTSGGRQSSKGGGPDYRAAISPPYDLERPVDAIVRLMILREGYDYLPRFALAGDDAIVDTVYHAFGPTALGDEPAGIPVGTLITFAMKGQFGRSTLQYGPLATAPDESTWWGVRHERQGSERTYEILVSKEGVPEKVRLRHPSDGRSYRATTFMAEALAEARKQQSDEALRTMLEEELRRELDRTRKELVEEPTARETRMVKVGAGSFNTVYATDKLRAENIVGEYWFSPRVPGSLVKFRYSSSSGDLLLAGELANIERASGHLVKGEELPRLPWNSTALSQPNDPPVTEQSPMVSEGSAHAPVELEAGSVQRGRVAGSGRSYYRVDVDRLSDVYVEVFDFAGRLRLRSYGDDAEYGEWQQESTGGRTLQIEAFFARPGDAVYFTVEDLSGEPGQDYSIAVRQEFRLDSIGVFVQEEAFTEAVELPTGSSHVLTLDEPGISYYRTTVEDSGTLRVQAAELFSDAELSWLAARGGSYSSVELSSQKSGGYEMIVRDLKPGTVCYYYVSGDIAAAGADRPYTLRVELR